MSQTPALDAARIVAVGESLGLTERESAVVALVHSDAPDKAIAIAMAVSPHTVRSHLRSIFGKLGAQSRTSCALIWERARVRHSRNLLAGRCDTAAAKRGVGLR